jgi:hypothetical protein
MTSFKVKDSQGLPQRGWGFETEKGFQVGIPGRKARKISGWVIKSPDGTRRFSEGNWQQFVPFAQQIISNYGCTSTLS